LLLIPDAIPPILFSIQSRLVEKVKVIVKAHLALVSIALVLSTPATFAVAARTPGSFNAASASQPTRSSALAEETRTPTPPALALHASAQDRHIFPVNDEKGLLLTCIAPDIEQNSETDQFNNCNLAPGRTLDDVMHSFVRGIHEEQRQRQRESADRQSAEERDRANNARK
jgi:hypothetical protein